MVGQFVDLSWFRPPADARAEFSQRENLLPFLGCASTLASTFSLTHAHRSASILPVPIHPVKTSRERWVLSSGLRAILVVLLVSIFCPLRSFAQPARLGDLDADGQPTVLDLQRLLNHLNSGRAEIHLVPNLLPYADLNEDGVINTNDVLLLQDAILGRSTLPNPYAPPVANVPTVATNGDTITLTGVARPNRQILITGGRFAVFVRSDSNGLFSAEVLLRANQVNALFVTASRPGARASASRASR